MPTFQHTQKNGITLGASSGMDILHKSGVKKAKCYVYTLPETNVAPENRPLERRFLLETTISRC